MFNSFRKPSARICLWQIERKSPLDKLAAKAFLESVLSEKLDVETNKIFRKHWWSNESTPYYKNSSNPEGYLTLNLRPHTQTQNFELMKTLSNSLCDFLTENNLNCEYKSYRCFEFENIDIQFNHIFTFNELIDKLNIIFPIEDKTLDLPEATVALFKKGVFGGRI